MMSYRLFRYVLLAGLLVLGAIRGQAQEITLDLPGGPHTFQVREIKGEAFLNLDEFATAAGVLMVRDDIINKVTLGPGTAGEIAIMPGFKSVRRAGEIETWSVAPVEEDGKIWAPVDRVRDVILPSLATLGVIPLTLATLTPGAELVPTPLPTRDVVQPFPWEIEPTPTIKPVEVVVPLPTARSINPPITRSGVKTVFIDAFPRQESAKPFLNSVVQLLTSRLPAEARVEVLFTQDTSGVRPAEAEIAAQANASAGLFISIQARLSDRSTDYVIYHYSPLVSANPGEAVSLPGFGIPWGSPDPRLAEQSALFARNLNEHLSNLLGRKGKGVRQGRLALLEGVRMPALVLDIRPDALFGGDTDAARKVADAILYAIMDTRNRLEGVPVVKHY